MDSRAFLLATLLCACGPSTNAQDTPHDPASGGAGGAGGAGGSKSAGSGGASTSVGAGSGGASTSGGAGTAGSAGNPGTGGAGGTPTAGSGGGGGSGVVVPVNCPKGSSSVLPQTAPALKSGTWVNISPSGVPFDASASAFTQGMSMAPCNPGTLYVCVRIGRSGIYKTTDGGGSWKKAGPLDGCVSVRVNPADPNLVYSGHGVGSTSDGFWVSRDGGESWSQPQAFLDLARQNAGAFDVYHVEPDPTDFNHVLLSFHSGWNGGDSAVFESTDGGGSFRKSGLTGEPFAGGYDVFFLFEPSLGIGNAHTWLFGTQGKGYWRTTNSGDSWTKVTETNMEHGGGQVYYAPDGTLYVSGAGHILKSKNNGESFTEIGPYAGYLSVLGDGNRLYAANHGGGKFVTAPLDDDTKWSDFNSQTFFEGPFEMEHDAANGILYAANIRAGVWALKIE